MFVGVGLLSRCAGRRDRALADSYRLMVVAVGLGALGLAGTALLAIRGGAGTPERFAPLAIGLSAGAVLVLCGLLRLPDVADRAGRRGHELARSGRRGHRWAWAGRRGHGWARAGRRGHGWAWAGRGGHEWESPGVVRSHVLDGTLIAMCALYIGWTLMIQPAFAARHAGRAVPGLLDLDFLTPAVPVVVITTAVGITASVLSPVRLLREGAAPAGAASTALPGTGTALTLVPASVAIIAAILRIAIDGSTDNLSIGLAALVGGLILARQVLVNRSAHSYARMLAQRESHLREMAFTDALTGLANRRQLHRVLAEQAASGRQGALLAIDMDGFKHVNDSRGHDVGDAVLVEVARRLRANLRPGDTAARLGGDEFAVLMWCGTEEAQRVADRLLAVLRAPYEVGGCALGLSASIGLAGCGTAENIPALLRNADLSLRYAKQRGKSRVERYDAAYNTWLRRRTTLEDELRGAIERDELCLVYQPVIELLSGRPVGVETLLRWYHPTLGPVSPAEFIPVAEDAGMIERIDNWVLHQACHQLSRWMADGHHPWLSVNISIRELRLDNYVAQVTEVLRAHRIPAHRLVLEVAEHAVAVDLEEVSERLSALREAGVRIALDDFGAGYSALGRLRNLPVDILKIDQMLIVDPVGGVPGRSAPLVSVVLELGRTLGLEVIAEGVAQPAQRAVVVAAGGRLGQGELLGRPMPAERFEALLAARSPVPAPRRAQDVGQVDSGREMRQS